MFNYRLKQLRKAAGLNQSEIAAMLSVGQRQVSNYESGKDFPSEKTLIQLADFFNVSLDYLLDRSDDPRSEEFSADRRAQRTSLKAKEIELLSTIPASLLPAYNEAKEKNPENLQQIIDTFTKMAKNYHSLTR